MSWDASTRPRQRSKRSRKTRSPCPPTSAHARDFGRLALVHVLKRTLAEEKREETSQPSIVCGGFVSFKQLDEIKSHSFRPQCVYYTLVTRIPEAGCDARTEPLTWTSPSSVFCQTFPFLLLLV